MNIHEYAKAALSAITPDTRVNAHDVVVLTTHRDMILSWEDGFIRALFASLGAHDQSAELFDAQQMIFENQVRNWYRHSLGGRRDETFHAYLAMIGVSQVLYGVKMPQILSFTMVVSSYLTSQAESSALPRPQMLELRDALGRLANTDGSIIANSYERAILETLNEMVGVREGLMARLLAGQLAASLDEATAELAAQGYNPNEGMDFAALRQSPE